MYKLRLGKSIKFDEINFKEKVSEVIEHGFDSMDLDLCNYWSERSKELELYKYLPDALETIKNSDIFFNGVHISFGPNWDFSNPDEIKRLAAIQQFKEMVDIIDRYKPNCYNIHGSFEPIANDKRNNHIENLKKSLKEMLEYTKTTICIENLPRTCLLNTATESLTILEEFPKLRMCVDVNHFLQESSESALLKLGGKVFTLHISDHDYENERHWLPKQGRINWMELIKSLETIGYSGIFNYECLLEIEAKTIKQNYDELFSSYNQIKNNAKQL